MLASNKMQISNATWGNWSRTYCGLNLVCGLTSATSRKETRDICEPRLWQKGAGGVGKELFHADEARNAFPGNTPQNNFSPQSNNFCWIYVAHFVYPSVNGHLGCLHLLAMVNNAAMDRDIIFRGIIIRIAGLYGSSMFNSLRLEKEVWHMLASHKRTNVVYDFTNIWRLLKWDLT